MNPPGHGCERRKADTRPTGQKVRLSLKSLLHKGLRPRQFTLLAVLAEHVGGRSVVVAVPLRRGPRVVARPSRLDAVQLQRQAKPRADAVSLVRPAERGAGRLERAIGGEDGAVLERFTVHRPKLTSVGADLWLVECSIDHVA
jgi:hypothetical protein